MGVNFRAELDLLNFVGVLVLLRFFVPLGLFIAEFSEIDQAADGGNRIGCDFDQVHGVGTGQGQGLTQGQHAKLIAVHADNPDLAGTDFSINPDERNGRRRRTWGERAAQDTLVG